MQNSKTSADYAIRAYRALCYRIAEAIHQWEKAPDKAKEDIPLIRSAVGWSRKQSERLTSVREVYKIEPDVVYASLEESLRLLEEGKPIDAEKALGNLRKSIEDKVSMVSEPGLA